MEKQIKDIRIITFSNEGKWEVPTVDIACAGFLFSAMTPKMSGIQFGKDLQDKEDIIEFLCNEISEKVYELHRLINE